MSDREVLERFAGRFVLAGFRDRFVHEATNRPRDLHRRNCHDMKRGFGRKFLGQRVRFKDDDGCLLLSWNWDAGFVATTWREAEALKVKGGGGYLVFRTNACALYAE